MKIWVDDIRPAPVGWSWCKSVYNAKIVIENAEEDISGAKKSIKSWEDNYEKLNPDDKEYYEGFIKPVMKRRIAEKTIELISLDQDAGDWVEFGGDYINILNWLEETGRNYTIHIHSANPVGVENMRKIIKSNGWEEKE